MTDQNPTLPAAAARVLDVWFRPLDSPKYPEPKNALWSGKNPQTDADLTAEFSDLLDAAGRGELAHWSTSTRGTMALIILLDQLSRNIHRDSPRMYALDDDAGDHDIGAGHDRRCRKVRLPASTCSR